MTDAVPSMRTRPRGRDRPLRTASGAPSPTVPIPACLAGLTDASPAQPPTERPSMSLRDELEQAAIEYAKTIPPTSAQRAAAERERQADLAQAFANAIEPHFTTGPTITPKETP